MNAEVFISYASEDRLRILDLVERLHARECLEEVPIDNLQTQVPAPVPSAFHMR